MMPDFLHVVPVGDDAMLNWILESEYSTFALSLVANIGVLLPHANHDALVPGPSYNCWKYCTRCIVTCEASLAHARSIVDHESLYLSEQLSGAAWRPCLNVHAFDMLDSSQQRLEVVRLLACFMPDVLAMPEMLAELRRMICSTELGSRVSIVADPVRETVMRQRARSHDHVDQQCIKR